jgi:hypothetical protein
MGSSYRWAHFVFWCNNFWGEQSFKL